jgi:two-component system phosphate regulon sensor histidine kinase PhoR
LSEARQTVLGALLALIPGLLLAFLLVMVLGIFVASKLTALLVRPIDAMNLEHPAENDAYEELTPLLTRLQAQNERIEAQFHAMEAHSRAFDTITENMAEGLVVLAGDGVVLSVNRSAARLFGIMADAAVSRHYTALTRDLSVYDAVKRALSGHTADAKLLRDGRVFQLLANPVRADGMENGAILLLLDTTEREQAEEARREFSANVSHELKTPLTSIAGYAEMLAAGMVRPEDTAEAAGKIHAEARRMITLIEDILALSKLDEGKAPAPMEQVELLSLARDVAAMLTATADAQEVSVSVEGKEAIVSGVRSVLEEMLFNLMENSIKYNRPGGKVCVNVSHTDEGVAVAVSDTGVGIAPEHQDRVFERFYHVDKSHSRITGGTGLGLSIVKHGAMLHGAEVALHTTVGVGTKVTVSFLK